MSVIKRRILVGPADRSLPAIVIDVVPPHPERKIGRGRWVVTLHGAELGRWRQPFFESARSLLAHGHPPTTPLQMRHVNGSIGLRGTVGEAAGWSVKE